MGEGTVSTVSRFFVERDGLKWHDDETVETVEEPLASMYTPLKQGVNEMLYICSISFSLEMRPENMGPEVFVMRPYDIPGPPFVSLCDPLRHLCSAIFENYAI